MSCSCGGSSATTRKSKTSKPGSTSSCSCGGSTSSGASSLPCSDTFTGGLERTRFFDGMVLTARDLADEQLYWRTKRKLSNRALGKGVVWGLRTEYDTRSETFVVNPGYALDCCGNDLVVSDCQVVTARSMIDRRNSVISAILATATTEIVNDRRVTTPAKAYLMLEYGEEATDARAVSAAACSPSTGTRYESSRVRESARLCLAPIPASSGGPTADFRDALDAIRDSLSEEDAELLFPSDVSESGDGPPLLLIVRVGDEERVIRPESDGTGGWRWPAEPASIVLTHDSASNTEDSVEVHVELRAAEGWILTRGSVLAGGGEMGGEVVASVTPPFDLRLAWSLGVAFPTTTSVSTVGFNAVHEAEELRLEPVFGGGSARGFLTVPLTLGITLAATTTHAGSPDAWQLTVHAGGANVWIAEAWENQEEDASTDSACCATLSPDIFLSGDGSSPGDPRAVLLGALYTWLSCVGTGATADDTDTETWSARQIAAQHALLVAWRILYGADATAPEGTQLADALQQLLVGWCYGFVYPGPVCTTGQHGAVLGTVTLSSTGRVLAFDPWAGRRHVMTGPLLEHWLGQVGVASPDVVVARIVSAVCCLSKGDTTPLAGLPDLGLSSYTDSGVTSTSFGEGSVALSGGASLLFGTAESVRERLGAEGILVLSESSTSTTEFLGKVLGAFMGGERQEPGHPVTLWSVQRQGPNALFLVLPADDDTYEEWRRTREALRNRVQGATGPFLGALGALGEAPYQELVAILARDAVIPTSGSVSTTLTAANRVSLGDTLALGPEGVLRLLRELGASPSHADVNTFWIACTGRLNTIAQKLKDALVARFTAAPPAREDFDPNDGALVSQIGTQFAALPLYTQAVVQAALAEVQRG